MRIFISLLLVVSFAACSPHHMVSSDAHDHGHHAAETHFEPHYSESLFEVTKNKHFSVEMLLKEGKFKVGRNALDIIIHGEGNRDVEKASIKIIPWMPEHGHGVIEKPVITERGAGLYSVENVGANMEGLWELTIDISANGVQDRVVFSFPDVPMEQTMGHTGMHHSQEHHEGMGKAPAGIDFSMNKMSDQKLFHISYKSKTDTIPLNKIHTWQISVNSAEGKPLSGADITVGGGMPEHGHGLPTRPRVTKEIESGVYLVEGMKFNMPGWWTVNFYLKAKEKNDSVTFNLNVQQ